MVGERGSRTGSSDLLPDPVASSSLASAVTSGSVVGAAAEREGLSWWLVQGSSPGVPPVATSPPSAVPHAALSCSVTVTLRKFYVRGLFIYLVFKGWGQRLPGRTCSETLLSVAVREEARLALRWYLSPPSLRALNV